MLKDESKINGVKMKEGAKQDMKPETREDLRVIKQIIALESKNTDELNTHLIN